MIPPLRDPASVNEGHSSTLPAREALRIAARLTDTEEDLHAITKVVLALVGADDDLTGAEADAALADAGVPAAARVLLMRALGPPPGRPAVAELRAGLEAAVARLTADVEPRPGGLTGFVRELQRRRVTRTALWYAGASVAAVEGAGVFVPMLGGPLEIVRVLAIAAVCGLPVALALAWVFDVAPTAEATSARWVRYALLAGICVASLGSAVAIWHGDAGPPAPSGPAPVTAVDAARIAVLGFTAAAGDDDLVAFATQLQTRLIDGLSLAARGTDGRPERLRVLSRASMLPFTRNGVLVDSLRDVLKAGTALEGGLERVGSSIRVRAGLIDTRTGEQKYTFIALADANDRIALLDAVADSVVLLIRKQLGAVVREDMRMLQTDSRAAFDRLAWAERLLEDFDPAFRRGDHAGAARVLAAADSLLAEAEQLDPEWLEPIVKRGGLAHHHVMLGRGRGDDDYEAREVARGIAHAERALRHDARNWRALELRGALRQLQLQVARPADEADEARLRQAAERDLRDALIGHPAPARPLRVLSELVAAGGRMEEAVQYGRQAYEADPFMEQVTMTVFRLFEYSFALGDDAEAARWCTEGRRRFAMVLFEDCRLALGAWSQAYPLSVDSAWAVAAAEIASYPQPLRDGLAPRLHGMVAAVLVRNGMPDSARSVLADAAARDTMPGMLRAVAGVRALLGDTDSALATVQRLADDSPALRATLRTAPELRGLADDARFQLLTREHRQNQD